jgi:hypothetical protein
VMSGTPVPDQDRRSMYSGVSDWIDTAMHDKVRTVEMMRVAVRERWI